MAHKHHHHDHGKDQTIGRLWISIGLNLSITVGELVAGLFSGSLALISDAVHNLGDTGSLFISLVARKISGKKADKKKTFGYKRAEIIGAFINLIVLIIVSLLLIKAAVQRFYQPVPVNGEIMLIVAIIAAAGNFGSAIYLNKGSKSSLNIKSAYIHMLADGLASIGVFVGGILIMVFQLTIVDPILTLLISGYIIWLGYKMLRETVDILMEGTPEGIDVNDVAYHMQSVEDVQDIHHVHVWQLDEKHLLLESHVVIHQNDASRIESIKSELKELLHSEFEITHSTLEFEWSPCHETGVIPHH